MGVQQSTLCYNINHYKQTSLSSNSDTLDLEIKLQYTIIPDTKCYKYFCLYFGLMLH